MKFYIDCERGEIDDRAFREWFFENFYAPPTGWRLEVFFRFGEDEEGKYVNIGITDAMTTGTYIQYDDDEIVLSFKFEPQNRPYWPEHYAESSEVMLPIIRLLQDYELDKKIVMSISSLVSVWFDDFSTDGETDPENVIKFIMKKLGEEAINYWLEEVYDNVIDAIYDRIGNYCREE